MSRKRGEDGKFVKNLSENEGLLQEIRNLAVLIYMLWRYSPLLLFLWILWKYIHVSKKLEEVFLEILCGSNCTCSCKAEVPAKSPI